MFSPDSQFSKCQFKCTKRLFTKTESPKKDVLKISLFLGEQKDNTMGIMTQNHTKHVYFLFFNQLISELTVQSN